MPIRDLIVIGAGPSGLSAAIAAKPAAGLPGARAGRAGGLDLPVPAADGVLHHARAPRSRRVAVRIAVRQATRHEALRYYRKVVDTYDLQIAFGEKVLSVEREEDAGVFALTTQSRAGGRRVRHARNVVFAIGYFDRPNLIGVPGRRLAARASLLRRSSSALPPAAS
jgi:thioredoxin reductase (NADPH)